MSWKKETFGTLLTESRIPCGIPDIEKRIRVKLNVQGVEKRPVGAEKEGATKQFIRKARQFIYGKQNFHKGAFGIIPPELDGFETSADIPSFDVREDCLPEWIYYFFKAGNRYLELTEFARGVGSQRIHPKQLQALEIPLPPIDIQRKIIAELEIIEKDEVSTQLTHQLDLVKQLRQAFLREAMQGKLVPQDPNDEPASVLLEKIKAEKERLIMEKKIKKQKPLPPITAAEIPFEIPENWVWCRLGEITHHSEGGKSLKGLDTPCDKNGWGVVKTSAITSGQFLELENKSISFMTNQYQNIKIHEGDLLFCRASGSKGLAGKSCIVRKEPYSNLILSDKSIRYILSKLVFVEYIYWYNSSEFGIDYYLSLGTKKSTTMNNITRPQFDNLPIPLPPLSEQKRIVAKLNEVMQYCDALEASIKASQQQNKLLLQQVLREALKPK
jgi:type I restriction enzyme, S subunit